MKHRGLIDKIKTSNIFTAYTHRICKHITSHLSFIKDFYHFKRLSDKNLQRFPILWKDRKVCIRDKTTTTGFNRNYVFHTAWAARILERTNPQEHIDFSSSIYFVTIVSAFIPTYFYEYRPLDLNLSGLQTRAGNLTALPFADNSIRSLSCMHVVEHIGLGRYGDPINPEGDLKAIQELKRVLSTDGNFIFVVPIGKPKVVFNAHRIYSFDQIVTYFNDLELKDFALIPEDPGDGGLIYNPSEALVRAQRYGCGCFWFTK